MLKHIASGMTLLFLNIALFASHSNLPAGFVYLSDAAPDILQEMRYASYHNFIGRPITGYEAAECVLTTQAAQALSNVQTQLKKSHLTLKVYDCYRPQQAVDDFIQWSQQADDNAMKAEFYPRVNKADLFTLGYIAARSGHTRGSTVDLTIVPLPPAPAAHYSRGQPLVACYASYAKRFKDNSIDMGTGYDCMDTFAHPLNKAVTKVAYHNRMLLRQVMQQYGFAPYDKEWWHFSLINEPFPTTYFTFPILPKE